jgi:hypothetical protein
MKSKMMRWAEHVTRTLKMRNGYTILAAETEGKRPLGRP